jgi:hypothetical protein
MQPAELTNGGYPGEVPDVAYDVSRILLGLIGAALLAACGSPVLPGVGPANPVTPTPPVVTTPGLGFDVLITERDHDATVHTGQKIEVVLRARSGFTDWSSVTTDNEAILAPIPTGITAARGVTIAGFKALAPGTATITAAAGPVCSPGQACPMYAVLFSVQVTVLSV